MFTFTFICINVSKTTCMCVAGKVDHGDDTSEAHGTPRRTLDDSTRHSLDVQLHLAAAVPAASEPQQLGDRRRLPRGGQQVPTMAHPGDRVPAMAHLGDQMPAMAHPGNRVPAMAHLGDQVPTMAHPGDQVPKMAHL